MCVYVCKQEQRSQHFFSDIDKVVHCVVVMNSTPTNKHRQWHALSYSGFTLERRQRGEWGKKEDKHCQLFPSGLVVISRGITIAIFRLFELTKQSISFQNSKKYHWKINLRFLVHQMEIYYIIFNIYSTLQFNDFAMNYNLRSLTVVHG